MSKGKKLVFVVLCIMFAMLTLGSVITIAFVAGVQTSNSSVNVMYQSNDVYVKIKANYYLGSNAVAMVNGNSTEVVLSPINHIGSLDQPDVDTTSVSMDVDSGGKVVFEYIFENLSDSIPAMISQMTNEDGTPYVPKDSNDNVNIQYVGTSKVMGASAFGGKDTISNIALLPLSTKYIYVIVSVRDLMHNVKFRGSFGWILTKADLVDNTTENASGGTIISGTDDADVVNKDEMSDISLVLDCENEKPNTYPQKANKCFTGWYTKDESGNDIEVEWPALITSSTKIYPKYEDETPGLSYTYTGDGYAIVGGYNGSTSNIFVPDIHNDGTHGNAKITSIADYAFQHNSKIVNLTIPNTITKIGVQTFASCSKLKSIFIPKSVISIGTQAFSLDYVVESVVVDSDNPVYDSRDNCNAINITSSNTLLFGFSNTVIPRTIKIIGSYAFQGVRNRDVIEIPNGVTKINSYSFASARVVSIIIPNTVTRISENAMYLCEKLTQITIPASVTSIGQFALSYCPDLARISVENGNPKYNSNNNCNAIIETSTNTLLFGCKNTVIPDSVTKLSNYAFWYCRNITSINIPRNIVSLSSSTFSGCTPTAITVDPANSVYDSRDNCNAIIETASNKLLIGSVNTSIPNTVTTIADYAFSGIDTIKSIFIPASVTKLSYLSFNACNAVTSIVIDSNNPVYDSWNNCNAIIETASNVLIKGCPNTTIPNTVTEIGDRAFNEYTITLTAITIPNSVRKIGKMAFGACYDLTSITIPNSVTYIGEGAFRNCTSIASITIPSSVNYIGANAFAGCASLASITFSGSTGWKVYDNSSATTGEEVTVSTTDLYYNSTLLKSVYSSKIWKKD